MTRVTDDPTDPGLTHGHDETPGKQAEVYIVLSEDERAKGFKRPRRTTYRHVDGCGGVTTITGAIVETFARDPGFYDGTFCSGCVMHRPVSEFVWTEGGEVVGT